MERIWIFDFDSTIIDAEALDVLVDIIEKEEKHVANEKKLKQHIESLTMAAMNGELSFDLALKKRLDLLAIKPKWIDILSKTLLSRISSSFLDNTEWLHERRHRIYIISGGFEEYIIPIAEHLGLINSHVLANKFVLKEDGTFTFDHTRNLSKPMGKVIAIRELNRDGKLCMVGDGYTDYETKLHGVVSNFYLYAEHVNRSHIISDSDQVVFSLSEIIAIDNE